MIELRYLMKSVPAPRFGPNISETVLVLQYRTSFLTEDVVGVTYTNWTEWQDVPTVTEES